MGQKNHDVISKPKDSQGYNTKDLLAVIKDAMECQIKKEYRPSFVVGLSFGADLSKWREVLREIFNSHATDIKEDAFNEVKKFEKAVLIVDPIAIKDKNGMGHLQADTLKVWLSGKSGSYLHTKLILIKFEKPETEEVEYVLIVSSKNITYSKSYDLVFTLYSQSREEKNGHGKELQEYLKALVKEKSQEDKDYLFGHLNGLENIMFEVKTEENEHKACVTDFMFSYEGHPFSDECWNELLQSDLVISPYLCEAEFSKWCEEGEGKRILTYWNSANKVKNIVDQLKNKQKPLIYVGIADNEGGRIKFHAKMYVSKIKKNEETHTKMWIGSANLTTEGKEQHYEMLIGIEFDDGEDVHNYIKTQILYPGSSGNYYNPLIEPFEEGKIGEVVDDEEEGQESNGIIRMCKYALFRPKDKEFEWRIYSGDSILKECHPVSREDIGNWIRTDENELFVCEDNYLKENNEEGFLTYEEYKELVSQNVKKMRGKYYRSIFLQGNPNGKKDSKGGSNSGKTHKHYVKYPCLYKKMMDINEKNPGMNIGNDLSQLYYGFMDSNDTENEIVSLMGRYINTLGEK